MKPKLTLPQKKELALRDLLWKELRRLEQEENKQATALYETSMTDFEEWIAHYMRYCAIQAKRQGFRHALDMLDEFTFDALDATLEAVIVDIPIEEKETLELEISR